MRQVRLFLSGGSHRAALGGVGTIAYLLDAQGNFRWSDVDEIVSVSGGTQPVGALVAARATTEAETAAALSNFLSAVLADGVTWRTPRRLILAMLVLIAVLAPIAFWVVAGLLWLPAWVIYPAGIVTLGFVYLVVTNLTGRFMFDYLDTVMSAAGPHASDPMGLPSGTTAGATTHSRTLVMCAVGIDSSTTYSAWSGPSAAPPAATNSVPIHGLSPVEAVAASSSLPLLARITTPSKASKNTPLAKRERLIDGGIGGNFGFQIINGLEKEQLAAASAGTERVVLAMDAGRRVKPSGSATIRLRRLSTVAKLFRWIQVSNDATYLNDIADMDDLDPADSGFIHVSRLPDAPTASSGKPKTGFDEVRERQERAIILNSTLSLFLGDASKVYLAVACGVIGVLLADAVSTAAAAATPSQPTVSLQDAIAALEKAGNRLGVGSALRVQWEQV